MLPPQPAPAMVQERPPRCCVTQRKARLCLRSSSSSQLPGLLSGLGKAGSKRFAASVLPAFTPGQCDSHSRWKWEKRELSPFFSLLSCILQAGFTHPEPPGEGWDAQELPRACPAPGLPRLQLPRRLRAAG